MTPSHFSHIVLSVRWHTALRQRNEDRQRGPLLAPPCAWGLRAGACKRCGGWFGPNFSAPARVRSKDGPPAVTRACCLRAASQWRLSIVCIPSKVVSKSATLLRIRALPVPWSTGCAFGCHLLRAVRIGRMGICVHSTLWRQFLIGMQPDVASGRCACSCACVLRASPVSIAR